MSKILKYKTFIAFMLVFTLSFGVVADYKKKEAQAFDFVITPQILWILGTLVLSTGIIAVNGEQIVDMGQMVVDRINDNAKLRGQIVFDGAIAVGLKIDDFIKDAVAWVAENLPTNDVSVDTPISLNPDGSFTVSVGAFGKEPSGEYIEKKYYNNTVKVVTFETTGKFLMNGNERPDFGPHTCIIGGQTYLGNEFIYFWRLNSSGDIIGSTRFWPQDFSTITIKPINNSISSVNGIAVIPYSNPKVRENYNEDKLPVALPWTNEKSGYIPIPTELPDTVITPDLPLTWDNVKDTVIPLPVDPTDAPSIPDVGEYELPSDLPLDDTGDITKGGILGGITDFFSFLWELLKALLMGILNLLKAILDLLLGLVNALLTGLKDLLIELFVPSDTYFTDVFEGFKSSLFQKLDITSYTRLFDADYTENSIKDITINIFGKTVTMVRFSMFEEFKEIVNTLIYAFMFFLLAIYNYNQIYKLIRGTDYVSASSTITHMGGGLTPGEQLKADSINRRLRKL